MSKCGLQYNCKLRYVSRNRLNSNLTKQRSTSAQVNPGSPSLLQTEKDCISNSLRAEKRPKYYWVSKQVLKVAHVPGSMSISSSSSFSCLVVQGRLKKSRSAVLGFSDSDLPHDWQQLVEHHPHVKQGAVQVAGVTPLQGLIQAFEASNMAKSVARIKINFILLLWWCSLMLWYLMNECKLLYHDK